MTLRTTSLLHFVLHADWDDQMSNRTWGICRTKVVNARRVIFLTYSDTVRSETDQDANDDVDCCTVTFWLDVPVTD